YGANVLPPVVYLKAQSWGRRKGRYIAAGAAGMPAAPSSGTDTAAVSEDGPEAASEPTRVRGRGGYGRVRGNESAPPLNINRSTGVGEGGNRLRAQTRSTDQAPSLSGNQSGSIPPRPSGGYTGTGDSGRSSVVGPAPGGNRSGSNGGGYSAGTGAGAGAEAGRAASAD